MKMKMAFPKRTWVLRVFAIFLVVMALLTFFSNTIMNMSLAQVTVYRPRSGSLSESIKGTGLIEAATQDKITLTDKRKIDRIFVYFGQEVREGELLMTLVSDEDNKDLVEAEKNYERLQQNYDIAKMREKAPNYESFEKAIKTAQKTLEDANADLSAALGKPTLLAEITDLQNAINVYSGQIDSLTAEIAALGTVTTELASARASVEMAQISFDAAKDRYDIANLTGSPEEPELKEIMDAARTFLDSEIARVAQLEAAQGDTPAKMEAKTQELSNATAAKANAEDLKAKKELAVAGLLDPTVAQEAVVTAQEGLTQANKALSDQKESDGISAIESGIADETALEQIAEAKQKVEDLRKLLEMTDIVAPSDGIVSTLNFVEGDEVPAETDLIIIDRNEEGYKVNLSFTKEQSQNFYIGMEARVDDPSWQANGNAVITGIRVDRNNPSTMRMVTFSLRGTFYPGQNATLSLINQSRGYDCIVPNSAIHEDQNGKFVFVMRTKHTPLGERNTALRVSVEVLATEKNNSALEPSALEGFVIITESNKPIYSGDSVRVAPSSAQ